MFSFTFYVKHFYALFFFIMHTEGVPVALNRLYLKITTPFQAIMCASGGS